MDENARLFVFVSLALAALVAIVGGLMSDVEGCWEDGARRIKLRQYLFVLRGFAACDGGSQVFHGTVFFGRIKLWRFDFGLSHLMSMGFTRDQAAVLHGARTGLFRLRQRSPQALDGNFFGTHFQFRQDGPKDLGLTSPQARTWQRVVDG